MRIMRSAPEPCAHPNVLPKTDKDHIREDERALNPKADQFDLLQTV